MKIRSQSQSIFDSPNVTRTFDYFGSTRPNPFTPSERTTVTNFQSRTRPTSTPILASLAGSPNSSQNILIRKLIEDQRPKTIARATRANLVFKEMVKERRNSVALMNSVKDKLAKLEADTTTPIMSRRSSSIYLKDEIEKTYKPNIGVIYAKKNMNISKERVYKHVINAIQNLEYEKEHASGIAKYIFDRPLSKGSATSTYIEKPGISNVQFDSQPLSARDIAPKEVPVERIRPETTKEYRDLTAWSKYNRYQVKNLKRNIALVQRKISLDKKASDKFEVAMEHLISKDPSRTAPTSPIFNKSPPSKFLSKEQSIEKRLEMNHKLSDLLKDYPKGNSGITSDGLSCPHFALKNHNLEEIEKVAKKNPDLKIDAERLADSENIIKGPNFRDTLTRIDRKLKTKAVKLGDLSSRATKEQIEKAVVAIVRSNSAKKHMRMPSPPKTKDKIFIEFDSALSHRNLKHTTSRPPLDDGEVMKSVSRLNDDLKRLSASCDQYIDSSLKFNGQMKRKVRRLKKTFNKLDRKMLGKELTIDRDIKKQIAKEVDNPDVYLAIKREEKRRRPVIIGV